jgi:hypothetical protein
LLSLLAIVSIISVAHSLAPAPGQVANYAVQTAKRRIFQDFEYDNDAPQPT